MKKVSGSNHEIFVADFTGEDRFGNLHSLKELHPGNLIRDPHVCFNPGGIIHPDKLGVFGFFTFHAS